MALTVVYVLLLIAFIGSWAYSLHSPNHIPETVTRVSALIALTMGLLRELQKSSLTVYFFFQRLAARMSTDTTGRWWFSARYDGEFSDDIIARLSDHLRGDDFRFNTKIEKATALSIELEIDQTLLLKVQYDPSHLTEDGGHVTLISRVLEVSYGHAKQKLERQIIPVLQAFESVLRPDNSSFELDVQFLKRNPFFAVYIAHLRPEQVSDYHVVLHVDGSHPSGEADKVEISKEKVHVTALSTHTFKSMAEQFVLLSPDVKLMRAAQ